MTDPLLPIGGSQALCQVDAEAHLDSAPPPALIGSPELMDVVVRGNGAEIGCIQASTNTTLYAREVRVGAPVDADNRSEACGDGAPAEL